MILRALCDVGQFSSKERWMVALVMSGLAAWLTAASIVNISASLVYHGVGGDFAHPMAAAIMVAIGGCIAAFATFRSRGNPWYALVFCWALLAIYFRGGQEASSIASACVFAAIMVALGALAGLSKAGNRRHWFGF
ncbi:MAG: hypothetical protein HRT64_08295 [Erythrobacter sp.]|nr:hypothetical protein [Erythrobacter sp.]